MIVNCLLIYSESICFNSLIEKPSKQNNNVCRCCVVASVGQRWQKEEEEKKKKKNYYIMPGFRRNEGKLKDDTVK